MRESYDASTKAASLRRSMQVSTLLKIVVWKSVEVTSDASDEAIIERQGFRPQVKPRRHWSLATRVGYHGIHSLV